MSRALIAVFSGHFGIVEFTIYFLAIIFTCRPALIGGIGPVALRSLGSCALISQLRVPRNTQDAVLLISMLKVRVI